MSDIALQENDTEGSATEIGIVTFPGTTVPDTTDRVFRFESVGTDSEFGEGFVFQLGLAPFEVIGEDLIDYFTFDPLELESVTVNFGVSSIGDYVRNVVFLPISGVSAVDGDVIGHWSGGYHDPETARPSGATDYHNFLLDRAERHLQNLEADFFIPTSFGPGGVETSEGTLSVNPATDAEAVWTLTGEPVVFAVYGLELSGVIVASPNPDEEILRPILTDETEYGEIDYSFSIEPKVGTISPPPDPVDPGPADPDPVDPGSPSGDVFFNDFTRPEVFTGTGTRDVYFADGPSNEFDLMRNADGSIAVEDLVFPDVEDTLIGIERIEFLDGTLAFDTDGSAGQTFRLYQAAFDRTPDAEGLGFWIENYDVGNVDLVEMAGFFMESEEFAQLYGAPETVDDFAFLTVLYANVLDRTPDQEGFDFWSNQQSMGLSRPEMLQYFSESVENNQNVAGDIADGIWFV